jgi:hypothetical protein
MAKVTIEFDTNEEATELREALDGYKWKQAVWEIDQKLRNELKYNEKLSGDIQEYLEKFRQEIRDILSDNKILLD